MMPGSVRYAREFTDKRRVSSGAKDDEPSLRYRKHADAYGGHGRPPVCRWLRARSRQMAWAIAGRLVLPVPRHRRGYRSEMDCSGWSATFRGQRGRSVVVAGDEQSPAIHALAHAMNRRLAMSERR